MKRGEIIKKEITIRTGKTHIYKNFVNFKKCTESFYGGEGYDDHFYILNGNDHILAYDEHLIFVLQKYDNIFIVHNYGEFSYFETLENALSFIDAYFEQFKDEYDHNLTDCKLELQKYKSYFDVD